ncbi:scaffolding protein [Xenorhabdus thuongxuanensis]|uniref:Scaffolding protein n=1 Tax=Xenorhabdus thuongxuanensis TaxID=1873484 RepID=A0A1Q5U8J7_9GAMM|nr:scaffolding protein [Xenorhabdus thuongxuanensis]OKP08807.1 hypothetical protein Xentx_00478 [Xenorhabdus thuongxuanensis]
MFDTAENTPAENDLNNTAPEQIPGGDVLNDTDSNNVGDNNTVDTSAEANDIDSEQVFYFGEEELGSPSSDEEKDQGLVKHLRSTIREKDKALKAFRRQQQPPQQPELQQPVIQPPRMPQLSDEGIDWDEDIYQTRMTEWADKNSQYLNQKAEQDRQQQALQQAHQQKMATYQARVKSLKVPSYQQAEQAVIDDVPEVIQAMILHFAEKPEMVVLALGRNAELRQQMANATDPVVIGRLIGSIESKARMMPKPKNNAATTPEVKGGNGAALNNLEKLKSDALESGNWDKYFAAKRARK